MTEKKAKTAHILLAEDDEAMRSFITAALVKAGYEVTSYTNGLDAFESLKDSPGLFDLLLTDIVMPGMDGFELAEKTGKIRPDLKIMFITGFSAVASRHHDNPEENTGMLSKPFHLSELIRRVRELLD